MENQKSEDKFLSLQETARFLAVCERTIYRLVNRGILKGYKLPGVRGSRFLQSEVATVMQLEEAEAA